MTLRVKYLSVIVFLLLSLLITAGVFLRYNLWEKLSGFDHKSLRAEMQIYHKVVYASLDGIDLIAQEWSQSDFIPESPAPAATAELFRQKLRAASIDYVLILGKNKSPILEEFNRLGPTGIIADADPAARLRLTEEGHLERVFDGYTIKGFLNVGDGGVLALSARPVFSKGSEEKVSHVIVVGTFLDGNFGGQLGENLGKSVAFYSFDRVWGNKASIDGFGSDGIAITNGEDNVHVGELIIRDLSGLPSFVIMRRESGDFFLTGQTAVYHYLAFLSLMVIVVGVSGYLFFDLIVARRLRRLNHEITDITCSGDVTERLSDSVDDEIGAMSRTLNLMLIRLERDERELFVSNERFRLVFETTVDAIIWCDPDKRIITNCNIAAEKLLRVGRNTIIGLPYESIFPNKEKYHFLLDRQVRLGPFTGELHVLRSDGERIPVSMTSALTEVEGRQILQAVIRDITDTKKAEERLLRAKEEAEKTSLLKSEFLNNVSHEIRTPLNAMIGFSELAMDAQSIDKARGMMNNVLSESKHLLSLINDLLDHAKIEAGKITINCEDFDLYNLLESINSIAGALASRKDIRFYLNIAEDVRRWYIGDSLRLRQIIMNLVGNAIKFTQKGSVTLRVDALNLGDSDELTIDIVDTGIGIPKNRQSAIFESFTQVDDSTSAKFGGTGLGTTISRKLSQLMGGDISLVSEVGVGSTFSLKISLPHGQAPQNGDIDVMYRLERGAGGQVKRGKILLVEDYPLNRELVSTMLRAAGHFVVVSENGEDAIVMCRNTAFDLILMDMQLPGMNGIEATKEIRADGMNRQTPIVGLTAHAEESLKTDCLRAGMSDFLTKPFERDIFYRLIEKWVGIISAQKKNQSVVQTPEETDAAADKQEGGWEQLPEPDDTLVPSAEIVEQYFFGKRELANRAVDMFINDTRNMLMMMENASQRSDYEAMAKVSHQIKSGAGYLGFSSLREIVEKIEQLCKDSSTEGLTELLQRSNETLSEIIDLREKSMSKSGN